MTPRDNDDARKDQPVDAPEAHSVEDEAAEPTVTRLSRADVRRYQQSLSQSSGGQHPQPAQPEPEGEGGEWHEVAGASGARGGRTGTGDDSGGPSGADPRSEPTPPREPREGRAAGPSEGSGRPHRRGEPLPAGAADEAPTRPLQRTPAADEAPTVVSRGPLVGEPHGSTPAGKDGPTAVMPGPQAREGRERRGARPAAGPMGAAGVTAAAAGVAGADARSARPAEQDEAATLRAEREARDRALGKRRPQPVAPAPVEPPSTRLPRTTDRFPASLGLFLLRLAVAAVVGVRGAQQLMDMPGTIEQFAGTALPYPEIFAWAAAGASVLIAVALVLGLAVRAAGVGAALIGIGALVFVYWWRSPFEPGLAGFRGEAELLMAVLGVFFLLVGGGAWGIDGAIRKGRLQRKAEKFEAERI